MTMLRSACAALALVLIASVVGCTDQGRVREGSEVAVAQSVPFTSFNTSTSYGQDLAANAGIVAATSSRFASYDATPRLVQDRSFGRWDVLSQHPLTVRYTIADDASWSDGVPVDAADLLLAWVANSGALNTRGLDQSRYLDPETLRVSDVPDDVVFFDGSSGGGLQLVTSVPELGDDGRSVTLVYDDYFPDWRLVFDLGMPAHIIGQRALGLDDAEDAKQAVVDAITDGDEGTLAAIAGFWNTGFDADAAKDDSGVLVSTGPYRISELADDHATLTANPEYRGSKRPSFETVTVRYIADPLEAVRALDAGEVDAISPQPSADVLAATDGIDGARIAEGIDGSYERLDLRAGRGRSGVFADPVVRRAFLYTVPREQMVDELVHPVQPDARPRSSHVFIPGEDGYDDAAASNGSDRYRDADLDRARSLLREAAVTAPSVCVLFDPANPRRVVEFQLLQRSASEAGFAVTDCSSPEWRDLLAVPGQYDAVLYGLRNTNLAASNARALFGSSGQVDNVGFYSDQGIDRLLDRIDASTDADEQRGLLASVDEIAWEQAYGMPLYQSPTVAAFRTDIEGVEPNPLVPGLLWNVWAWTRTGDR